MVQRPANAVKELVENAIDAESTRIQIFIQDAGKTKITVRDNGKGMTPEDARLCFERHATSKITDASDLMTLTTKGFRGEALASMAAVAKIELLTSNETQGTGTRLELEDGIIITDAPVSCEKGTQITLKHLFYNVPARRNFLKSDSVEFRHILEETERLALAHPEIEFKLTQGTEELLRWPAGNEITRIKQVLGVQLDTQLLPIEEFTPYISIKGFIGLPQFALKNRKDQYLFINKRFVRYPYLHHAILQAYESLIPETHQPRYVLFLTLESQHVDVNIHPTKTEVKLDDERTAYHLIQSMVKRALGKANAGPSLDFNAEMGFMDLPARGQNPPPQPGIQYNAHYHPEYNPKPEASWEKLFSEAPQVALEEQALLDLPNDHEGPCLTYAKRYLVYPSLHGIMILDLRRARERIVYEHFLLKTVAQSYPAQELLFPESFELNAAAAQWMRDWQSNLLHFGIRIEPFGGSHFILYALPSGIELKDAKNWIENLRETCLLNNDLGVNDVRINLAQALALNTTWEEHWVQNESNWKHIRKELAACENPNFSPRGKPIQMCLKDADIRNFFKS